MKPLQWIVQLYVFVDVMIVEIFIWGGSLLGLDIVLSLAAPGPREGEESEQSVVSEI